MLILVTSLSTASHAAPWVVVSPIEEPNLEASTPFFWDTSWSPSLRYQQVYNASDFMSIGSPMLITEMVFYPTGEGVHEADIPNIQISFSTTSAGADSLSPMFANNVGGDDTMVWSGRLYLRPQQPGDFYLHISLPNPFRYEPTAGNLLLDVRTIMPAAPIFSPRGYIQGVNILGDTVSSMIAVDVNSPIADYRTTTGLATTFFVTPIPEPSFSLLCLVSIVLGSLEARKRRQIAVRREKGVKKGVKL